MRAAAMLSRYNKTGRWANSLHTGALLLAWDIVNAHCLLRCCTTLMKPYLVLDTCVSRVCSGMSFIAAWLALAL